MSTRNPKKTFALLTVPTDEKVLEVLTFNDAEIITDNKYTGKEFLDDAATHLLELKNKNLEGVILDFYCHEDNDFLEKVRQYFFDLCESKTILCRLVYQNVIFTSMLLYHSELDFNPEDTVYSIWIKKDNFVSYKLEESTLYFINEMKITDDFLENEEYDQLLDCENPKFLVLGSRSSDVRLKQMKTRFKAQKTKVMYCTYEDCLKKSASHYLSRFIRAKDWRWNFKLSESTNPIQENQGFPRRRRNDYSLLKGTAFLIAIAAIVFGYFWYNSNSPVEVKSDLYYEEITKISKNDNEIYGFIMGVEENIRLTIYGAQSKHGIGVIDRRKEIFLIDFLQIFNHSKLKAVVINIDDLSEHVDYYNKLSKLFSFIEIPHAFMDADAFKFSCLLAGTNTVLNIGETVRIVILHPENAYEVKELQYTEVGYRGYINPEIPETFDSDFINAEILRHKVLGHNNPAKILLYSYQTGSTMMRLFRDIILKDDSDKVIPIEGSYKRFESRFVYEKIKWMFDKSYTKFHIPPGANRKYMIAFKCGGKDYPLIVCEKNEVLPFKKSILIPKTPFEYFVATTNQYDFGLVIQKQLPFLTSAHAYKIGMEIDVDNFVNTTTTSAISLALSSFSSILDDSFVDTPVIAFYGDLSFIYVYDEIDGYQTLRAWNGEYGQELYISFDEGKPKYFEKALQVFESTCSSVVHDVIKVMSTSPDELSSLNPTLGYSLSTDSDNQIWYHVNSTGGTTKRLSPIMAMVGLLKKHVQTIKRETDTIPEKLLFYLFDEFNDAAKKRVKKNLKECCKRMDIECTFIKTLSTKFLQV